MTAKTPTHAPRRLRSIFCRRCGHETCLPGCVYCDECRPQRLSDDLMSPQDRDRIDEIARAAHVYIPILAPRPKGRVPAKPHAGRCSCGRWESEWMSNPNFPREAHNEHLAEHGIDPR